MSRSCRSACRCWAGPGAIVTVILAVQKADSMGQQVSVGGDHGHVCRAVADDALFAADHPADQEGGVVLVTRLSGMLLSAIAVQQIADDIFGFIRGEG
jgi:multiple antibiotic resistance protein